MTKRQLAYLAFTLFMGLILMTMLCIGYTNHVDQQRIEGERAAAAARAQQSEQTRLLICDLALSQVDVFTGSTSPVGQKALLKWSALADRFNCH